MMAAACLLLANLYYPQPILGEVARALRLSEAASGAGITAGQLGYIAGLLLVAPLGDMWENRRLCGAMTAGAGLCALAALGLLKRAPAQKSITSPSKGMSTLSRMPCSRV
ncbi:MAG: MFS transporter [Desulfovibrio sp.]|nr:MFS transporter [Desulfovibrio sp.]